MPDGSALQGVRVVELVEGLAGAYCGKLLAGLGADVLKVEPPSGDSLRRAGPFPEDHPNPEASGLFLHLNPAKRSVTLAIETETGRRLLGRLLDTADVLVHDLAPGRARAIGLDDASLRNERPSLVAAAVTFFGSTGPYADFAGTEIVAQALSGYMSLTGDPDREPLKPYGYLAEYQAGLHAAVAVMAAVLARDATDEGDLADVSVTEAACFALGGPPQLAWWFDRTLKRNGTRLIGVGGRHPYPSTLRPCADGWVHAHSNNRNPELLAALVGDQWLASPEVLDAMTDRADEIDAVVDRWLADKTKWQAVAAAQEMRLPFTEVLTPAELLEDREGHLRSRGELVEVEHPVAGTVTQLGPPVHLGAGAWVSDRAPLLGEHTADVLCGTLGLTHDDLLRLRQAGVV